MTEKNQMLLLVGRMEDWMVRYQQRLEMDLQRQMNKLEFIKLLYL